MSIARYDLTEDCTTGKVDITPVPETMEGRYVSYEDYAALEARCAALAAENAGLNDKMNKLATWPGIEFYSSAWEFCNLDGNDALEFMCDVKTPATDTFLAELRAQGVEMFAMCIAHRVNYSEVDKSIELDALSFAEGLRNPAPELSPEEVVEFAAQLRKGAAL